MAKVVDCRDCGNQFEIPVQRGRPAVRCTPCKEKKPTIMAFSKNGSAPVDLKLEVDTDGITWIESSEPCRDCGVVFMRPRKRGKPPVRCEKCKSTADAVQAIEVTTTDERLDELFTGDKTLLQGTPGERPKGAEAQCPTTGKCGRIFTSNSSCDMHKQWLPNGSYKCIDPATLGMEPRSRKRDDGRIVPVWTRPTPIEGE